MKVFVCYALLATIAINYVGAASSSISNAGAISSSSSSSGVNTEVESEVQAPVNQGLIDLTRLRKSAYGGGGASGGYGGAAPGGYGGGAPAHTSIPAPPCPKNYLFSCQPNLAPVPCSGVSASQGYGSAGAYSSPIASYVNPNYGRAHHQPIYAANPAAFLPQAYAYQY